MTGTVQTVSLLSLAIAFIPVAGVVVIIAKWQLGCQKAIYAVARMLLQLLLIGYFLTYIFKTDNGFIVFAILTVMLVSASWIALRTLSIPRKQLFMKAFLAVFLGGGIVLALITQAVLDLSPWYLPSYMIPLAGMIFANSMNSISLAGERFEAEINRNVGYEKARNIAMQAALIPITNSLLAVGLVSLPGMMTGQIISGVSPLIAARYQIMVMCMIFGSAGISAALFLTLLRAEMDKLKH